MTEDEPQSIIDSLASDHEAITDQLASATIADATDEALIEREQLVMTLIRHFVAEEQYLYPTLHDVAERSVSADGERQLAADRMLENQLRTLEESDLTAAAVGGVLKTVRTEFAAHVAAQQPFFQALEQRCSAQTLAELGADVRGAEQLAPTRPRRVVPHGETANKIVSFVEGYLDHIRDHYSHRGIGAELE